MKAATARPPRRPPGDFVTRRRAQIRSERAQQGGEDPKLQLSEIRRNQEAILATMRTLQRLIDRFAVSHAALRAEITGIVSAAGRVSS